MSTASVAPHSCQKPSRPLTRTIERISRASVASRRKNDNATAKSRIRMMGLWNCASSRVRTRFPHTGLCREGVTLKSLCLAPSAERPSGVLWRWSSRSSKVTDQKVVRLWSNLS